MNWFEDDSGAWWNLDRATAIYPPGHNPDNPNELEIEFADTDERYFSPEDWPRLKAQLLNSQRPADRRPEPMESTAEQAGAGQGIANI